MKKIYYYIIILLLIIINTPKVYADCTEEEINSLKNEIDKIEITYKHLGEVTKDDGSKVYNEFLVTAKNIPENVYVHLSPMTEEKFYIDNGELKIKLTTGEWEYDLYSPICETTVDEINIKLPTFNKYSLDPLCEGIDENDFKLCARYYEYEVDRETFDRRVKEYRQKHFTKEDKEDNKKDYVNVIINYIKAKYIYIAIAGAICIIIVLLKMIVKKKNRRKTL